MAVSLEPWVISMTEIPRLASAAKSRAATPGTPSMPGPKRLTSATPRVNEMPQATRSAFSAPSLPPLPSLTALRRSTSVPGCSGRKVLRMRTGTPAARAGAIVRGCRTLAPKCASSIASS